MEVLISFILATTTLAISPGPDNIFVLTQSMVNGRRYGMATVFGLMTGCLIHTSLVAFGVSGLIKQNPAIFLIIKIFGAIYMLYLAYKVFKSDSVIDITSQEVVQKPSIELFKTGFWMNVLNPKVTLFFLAFFPQFLFSTTLSHVWQFYILGGIFIITSFTVFSGIALLAGTISSYITKNRNVGIYLKWGQIIVFVLIATLILV